MLQFGCKLNFLEAKKQGFFAVQTHEHFLPTETLTKFENHGGKWTAWATLKNSETME